MLARTVVAAVRRKLNDPDAKYQSDVTIAAALDQHVRMLYRDKVDADPSYGRTTYSIASDDANSIYPVPGRSNAFSYWFPAWLYRVHAIYEESGGERGAMIPYNDPSIRLRGRQWHFAGDRSIELIDFPAPISIQAEVSKIPSPAHWGTVQEIASSKTSLVLEPEPSWPGVKLADGTIPTELFGFSFEPGGYVGAEVELTTAGTFVRNPRGHVAVVVAQDQVWSRLKEKWTWRLTLRPGFNASPKRGDSYEMHFAVNDANLEYLVLKTASSIFERTQNTTGIATLAPKLQREERAYINSLRPRQEQDPLLLRPVEEQVGISWDLDRAWPE